MVLYNWRISNLFEPSLVIRESSSSLKFKGRSGIEPRGVAITQTSCHVWLFPSDKAVRIVQLDVAKKHKALLMDFSPNM